MTEPTTAERNALGKDEARKAIEEPQHKAEMSCDVQRQAARVTKLIADVERLTKDARQNAELCKADNAWAMESYEALTKERDELREKLRMWIAAPGQLEAKLEQAMSWLEEIQDFNAPGFPKGATTFLEETKP